MNKDQQHFEEQDAPLKNTDKAFVKVREDGSPDKSGNMDQAKDKNKKERANIMEEDRGRHK